jgi:hypothetical protein
MATSSRDRASPKKSPNARTASGPSKRQTVRDRSSKAAKTKTARPQASRREGGQPRGDGVSD